MILYSLSSWSSSQRFLGFWLFSLSSFGFCNFFFLPPSKLEFLSNFNLLLQQRLSLFFRFLFWVVIIHFLCFLGCIDYWASRYAFFFIFIFISAFWLLTLFQNLYFCYFPIFCYSVIINNNNYWDAAVWSCFEVQWIS